MMFKNLRAEMAREGLLGKDIAGAIGVTAQCFYDKMSGRTEFKRSEMQKIKDLFFREMKIDDLFEFSEREKVN